MYYDAKATPAPVGAVRTAWDRSQTTNAEPTPGRPLPCEEPGLQTEREERNLIDEVLRIQAAEASIDAFIERRAEHNEKANAEEMMWKASVRKHHDRLRQERLRDRLAYHEEQLVRHTKTFEELMRRHRVGLRSCEEALGITNEERESA